VKQGLEFQPVKQTHNGSEWRNETLLSNFARGGNNKKCRNKKSTTIFGGSYPGAGATLGPAMTSAMSARSIWQIAAERNS
jgi:hypothetical protein